MRNADGTVTVKTRGRDKRGNTGGGTLNSSAGPLAAVAPGIKGAAPGIKLVTKRTAITDSDYR